MIWPDEARTARIGECALAAPFPQWLRPEDRGHYGDRAAAVPKRHRRGRCQHYDNSLRGDRMSHPNPISSTGLLLTVLAALTLLSACSSDPSPEATKPPSSSSESDKASQSSPSPTPEQRLELLPTQTVTQKAVSRDGKSQTVTFEIGPVVSGQETELIKNEWVSRGGKVNDVACLDRAVSSKSGGFAVGTMKVVNDTPDFPAGNRKFQFIGNNKMYIGLGFSGGSTCSPGDGKYIFGPSWQKAIWGPVPVVIAINDYRTPNSPAGDPGLLTTPGNLAVKAAAGMATKWIDYDTGSLNFVQVNIPLVQHSPSVG